MSGSSSDVVRPAKPSGARTPSTDNLLSPWPKISLKSGGIVLLIMAVYAWAMTGTESAPSKLIEGFPAIVDIVSRMLPPRVEFWIVAEHFVETLQMALIGTTGGIILSLPFALLAARNISPHPWIYQITRILLNINRAIPELIFALMLVAAVGLGPFGGVLAIAIGSIGSLGKIYAENIEAIDPQQVMAVRATGAGPLTTFLYGVLPQVLPVMTSYSIYYFEVSVRAATILGVVGAGGIGFIIQQYMALFQYDLLFGALIFMAIAITLLDRLSDLLRRRIT
ncbi:MAG TPA: phosphonate ABC transporter, permease protein PhnE [Gammaproteobacteria bacterium]|nr:MAG: phosphonate ABC transporter, permease protein PhnE [Gammaproteobacteria bacterium TMED163]HAU25468.1 phosphonate ABC transporter, permease protein PhnE [Gammaproteobacteria bacterium]